MVGEGRLRPNEPFCRILQGPENVPWNQARISLPCAFTVQLTVHVDSLAWAELFLILGNLFRKVDLEIVDTT